MQYIISFIILVAIAFLYKRVAIRFRIIDKPNHRSSHTKPTIRGGGILFFFGLLIAFYLNDFQYPYFFMAVTVLAILSFIDDMVSLKTMVRLPIQIIAVTVLFYQVGLENFPLWTYLPVLVLGVGFINLFNFLDGINGITGLSSLIVIAAFYYVNQDYPIVDDAYLLVLGISVVVFGFFNFRKKAIMFAGDVGSITMGMIVVFLGVKYIIATGSPLIVCTYMVFGADSTLTLMYRVFKREKISDPHRHHIYQKLVDNFQFSHMQVSLYYTLLQAFVSIVAIYVMYHVASEYHFIIGFGISQVLTALYIYLFRKNAKKVQQRLS